MGQLESLRELSIAQPYPKRKKRKLCLAYYSDGNPIELGGIESLHLEIILSWFTLHSIELMMPHHIICKWLNSGIPIHFEDGVYPFKLANE
jgi:hypothetical protein